MSSKLEDGGKEEHIPASSGTCTSRPPVYLKRYSIMYMLLNVKNELRLFYLNLESIARGVEWVRRRGSSHLKEQCIPDIQKLWGVICYGVWIVELNCAV